MISTPCVTIESASLTSNQPSKIFIAAFFKDDQGRKRLEFGISLADLELGTFNEGTSFEGRLHDLISHGVREALGPRATRHIRMSWVMPHSKLAELAGVAVDGVAKGHRKTNEFGPPVGAHRFLDWALPAARSAEVIGDLDERYHEFILPRDGKIWADLWYWRQSIGAVLPMWRRAIWIGIKGLGVAGVIGGVLGWLWEKLSG